MSSYLVNNRLDSCSGCRACLSVCPVGCILMVQANDGFRYPRIDTDKCISCKQCQNVCPYDNSTSKTIPRKSYAAVNKNYLEAKASSSAGVFFSLASYILSCGGVVFGAAFDSSYVCRHIKVESEEALLSLRKSKYVQSDTLDSFIEVKRILKQKKKVLYSGTPCQIAGLLNYVDKMCENLITVDVACHGVPSQKDFDACLAALEERYGKISDLVFRDKNSSGWKHALSFRATKNGKTKKYVKAPYAVPYYYYFLHARNLRESCYSCPYIGVGRVSDITLSDFWGAEKVISDELKNGVSAVLCNTPKGVDLFNVIKKNYSIQEVSVDVIAKKNQPLKMISRRYEKREELLAEIMENGYSSQACSYISLKERIVAVIKNSIPDSIKWKISKIIGG